MSMFRRHLTIVPSRIYQRGVVLRDPLAEVTVQAFGSLQKCKTWCRQNGWPASLAQPEMAASELREHEAKICEPQD